MKYMKTINVPASTREVLDKTVCDVCSSLILPTVGYSAEAVEVRHRTGNSYPEGGDGHETVVDMCGRCFDERLIPWLRARGSDPKPEPWSW